MDFEYSIIKTLGNQQKRKFGDVYLIRRKNDDQFYILKQLIKTNKNVQLQARLRNEARFNFENEQLPKVIHFKEDLNKIQLFLTYKNGIPLIDFWKTISKKKRITILKIILNELAESFEILKSQKIIHADIKPDNLIIEENNGVIKVHLIDFGMAYYKDEQHTRKTLFNLAYSSPEIILNRLETIDYNSDYFSIGITIFRLFEGKLPFSHPNPSILTNILINVEIPYSTKATKELNSIIQKLCVKPKFNLPPNKLEKSEVQKKLNFAIKKRYDSYSELIIDINSLTENYPSIKEKLINFFSKP